MPTLPLHNLWDIHLWMVTRVLKTVKNEIISSSTWLQTFDKHNEYKDDDVVTTADYAAQQLYTTMIGDVRSDAGIVAEEHWLRKNPQGEDTLLYTIDPVDGTKALVRKQSDGIWTLLWVVDTAKKEIIAAYVWDIMTDEIYYYHPWTTDVYRMNLYDTDMKTKLMYQPRHKKRIQMLDDIRRFPVGIQTATERWWYRDSLGITNGSIWTNMARLWKGEVDAMVLKSWMSQPWDRVPCAGISNVMWYTSIQLHDDNTMKHVPLQQSRKLEAMQVPYQLIIHQQELADVLTALQDNWFRLQK